MLATYQLPAGVVSTPTKTSRSANWADANLIRWANGKLEPVGGWERFNYADFASDCRAVHTWTSLNGDLITAFVCEAHVYVDRGDGIVDISPTVALTPPYSDISAGGYGDNVYNFGTYGTLRPTRPNAAPITPGYYADNWGEDLIVMTGSDGRLLRWSPSAVAGTKLAAVTGAPVGNRAFVITPQRHVILFGAGGIHNREAWCSQEDIEDWNYASVTNTAGFYDVEPASPIIAASKAGDEVIFFSSSGDVFRSQYIGTPYIYNYEKIASGIVPISPNSVEDTPIGAVWATFNGFWKYDSGSVSPVGCNVWTWITDSANAQGARYNAVMVPVSSKSELWWFYPDAGNTKNTRYVMWNYKEGWWSVGRMKRSAGGSSTYSQMPIMANGKKVYRHESGWFYNDSDPGEDFPWATTFSINSQNGARLSTFWQLMPDIEGPVDALAFSLNYNIPRSGNEPTSNMNSIDRMVDKYGYVNFRDTGRDFRLTVKQVTNGAGKWSVGDSGFDIFDAGTQ